FKKENNDVGRNAREVIRKLDKLRKQGELSKGVTWNGHGGSVRVDIATEERPGAIAEHSPDNRILGVAWNLKEQGQISIVVSKDINVRLKADALSIRAEDFEAQKVDAEHLYSGYVTLDV